MNQQQKLKFVAQELGLSTLSQMQGSTRNVFDTLANPASANTSFEFFKNVGQRAFPNTNISDNRFQVNEALLVEYINVYRNTTAVGAGETTPIGITPITGDAYGELIIGNQSVLKDIPFDIVSQSNTDKGAANNGFYLAPLVGIVIPPQVEFHFRVTFESSQGAAAGTASAAGFPSIGCELYGTGVLLNLKSSL
jgi:hypothetical protein